VVVTVKGSNVAGGSVRSGSRATPAGGGFGFTWKLRIAVLWIFLAVCQSLQWLRDPAPREGVIPVTIEKKTPAQQPARPGRRPGLGLGALIGSGDRIGAFVLPFVLVGVALNIAFPETFSVGGPPPWLQAVSALALAVGVVVWAWSVLLILTKVRAGELVTTGPYSLVKHPLYTSVALLVLPWLGFLLDTWLGALIGIALYIASRLFAPAEEADLAGRFGPEWDAYCHRVKVPWL
jgi:protein-S-isoprenylcysteine O-methyltransferase Ste14